MFAQSRLSTEILTTYLKDDFEDHPGAPERIRGYRGGYLPHRRREIEKGPARGHRAGRRVDQRARARHRHRRARRVGDGRLPGHDCRHVAAGRPRRPPRGPVGRRARGVSSAPLDQFIVRNPSYFFDALAGARADRSGQPAHPRRSHQVRGVRAAVSRRAKRSAATICRRSLASWPSRASCTSRGGEADASTGRGRASRTRPTRSASARSRPTTSSSSIRRGEPRVIGETDFTSGPATLHAKAIYIIEGQLFQVEKLDFDGRKAFVRADRLRLLHRRHHVLAGHGSRYLRGHGVPLARRGARGLARRGLQEDQVLHERERRLRRAGPARAADAHDVVLADGSAGRDGGLPYAAGRPAGRRGGPRVCAPSGGAAAADVRSARRRHFDRYRGRSPRSRASSSTTTIPAASGSASRFTACTRSCSGGTRRLIAECPCESGCPGCVGPVGNTGPLAKTAALRILERLIERLSLDPAAAEPGARGDSRVNISDRVRAVLKAPPPAPVVPASPQMAAAGRVERALGGEWREAHGSRCSSLSGAGRPERSTVSPVWATSPHACRRPVWTGPAWRVLAALRR